MSKDTSGSPATTNRFQSVWREWLRPILIVVLVATAFRSAVADWNDVPTGSMKPTILEGDRIFVNKLAYDLKLPYTRIRLRTWANPQRGDIVILYSPEDGKRLVKRVVGLPGDTVAMLANRLAVNGGAVKYAQIPASEALSESPGDERLVVLEEFDGATHHVMLTPGSPTPDSFGPVEIPAD
jgi:signal peptidase I